MTFKSKLSYEEFTEKFGPQSEKSLYYRISIGKNGIGIKRRGDRTFNERGKVLDKSPLKLQFT
ncbi:MAG: hypothetical protein LBT20_07260, partial [Clostridiales bacterium]|nr:hypothetical protein [Clostridiales bacterium]